MAVDRGNGNQGGAQNPSEVEEKIEKLREEASNTFNDSDTNETRDTITKNVLDFGGFSGSSILAMGHALSGNEVVERYKNGLKEILEKIEEVNFKIFTIDRSVVKALPYSLVIVAAKDGNKVAYFTNIIEATGKPVVTAAELDGAYKALNNNHYGQYGQQRRDPSETALPGDIFNKNLRVLIESMLADTYKKCTIVNVESISIPADKDPERIIKNLAKINYLATVAEVKSSEIPKINIAKELSRVKNTQFNLNVNIAKVNVLSAVDDPILTEWSSALQITGNNESMYSMGANSEGSVNQDIVTVKGTVESSITRVPMQTYAGQAPQYQTKIVPNICINSFETNLHNTESVLLAIITALPMTIKDNLVKAYHNKGADTEALNMITNMDGNETGIGETLDLKSIDLQAAYGIIDTMLSDTTQISVDVDVCGNNTWQLAVLGIAQTNTNARKEIIRAAHHLTNGIFPKEFPLDKIFSRKGTVIPSGVFDDNQHDARELDLAKVTALTNGDHKAVSAWDASNYPLEKSRIDPFTTRLDIVASINQNIKIKGKISREVLHPEFVAVLKSSAEQCGLNATHRPVITLTQQTEYGTLWDQNYGNQNITFSQGNQNNGFNGYNVGAVFGGYGY